MRAFGTMAGDFARDLRPLADLPTDLLLAQTPGALYGVDLAESLGVPLVQGAVIPLTPTTAFPIPGFPPAIGRVPGGSRFSYTMLEQLVWQVYRPAINRLRRDLGLRPWPLRGFFRTLESRGVPLLHGFSPRVLAPPADWHPRVIQTGYWLPPAAPWTPPDGLQRFLDAGPPPLFVGFGSMSIRDPQRVTACILAALARTGQRALLHAGWAGLGRQALPAHVYHIDQFVPYGALLPRTAAVIHHGGSGTTAQALTAGVPSLVVPFLFDQFFWGRRVAALGAGPPPLPLRRLTVDRLVGRIALLVGDAAMGRTAAGLALGLQAEDGIGAAVGALEQAAARGRAV